MRLHREAVPDHLWTLLVEMMAITELKGFRLVGGTALALHMGHRCSVDIDMFTDEPFDATALAEAVPMSRQRTSTNSVTGEKDGIKVDLMSHRYPWLDPAVVVDGVRLTSLRDIAALKLNAIANRGSKKDFWDIAALLDSMTIDDMLQCYRLRYPHMDDWQVMRSLAFFDDAEQEPDPVALTDATWPDVKARIAAVCLL